MAQDDFDDEVRGDHNGHEESELGSMRDGNFIPHKNTHYFRNISVAALASVALIAGIFVFKSHHHAGTNM